MTIMPSRNTEQSLARSESNRILDNTELLAKQPALSSALLSSRFSPMIMMMMMMMMMMVLVMMMVIILCFELC